MSEIKLCCLIDPMSEEASLIQLFDIKKMGRPLICKKCYNDLMDSIPESVRGAAASRGVWEAIVEFVHLKFKQEHLSDS